VKYCHNQRNKSRIHVRIGIYQYLMKRAYEYVIFCITGEISSISIDRNGLTQKRHDTSFIETVEEEEDDEQFISDMKKKIDQNYKL